MRDRRGVGLLTPEELKIGDEVVVSVDVEKGGEEHPQLDPFDLVTVVNPEPDSDGEVYVVGKATEGDDDDEVNIGAWVHPRFLLTQEQADSYIEEHGHPLAHLWEDEETGQEIREFSYIPHSDYPNLPRIIDLPIGYVMEVIAFHHGAMRAINQG